MSWAPMSAGSSVDCTLTQLMQLVSNYKCISSCYIPLLPICEEHRQQKPVGAGDLPLMMGLNEFLPTKLTVLHSAI